MKKTEVKDFETFLMRHGALVLPVTNEWELVRFRCDKGTGLIYQNKKCQQTFCGPAQEAYSAFKNNLPWSCIDKAKRTKRMIVKDEIISRDGDCCFYCGEKFGTETDNERSMTLEHLLAISSGGNNHINNLVLAHQICNWRASDMALIEKIKLRESMRAK